MGTKKFGKAIDLGRLLGNRTAIKPRIKHIGVELEGGWLRTSPEARGGMVIRDSSVHGLDPNMYVLGEIPSPRLERQRWTDWVSLHYPPAVNHTCGMHVHMSFALAAHYMRCMNPSLPATIVEHFTKWAGDKGLTPNHPIWPRLRGESRYCQHVFAAEDQILMVHKDHDQSRAGNRYSVLNFAYSRTGTVECRLLPMMDTPELAIEAINELLDVVDAFLVATAAKEPKIVTAVTGHAEETPIIRQIYV